MDEKIFRWACLRSGEDRMFITVITFVAFTALEKEFPDFLVSFSRDNMFERFGQFYVKHKEYQKAINYYKKGLQKFPKSVRLSTKLSEVYNLVGK